jgi:hypothetical protein
VIHKPALANISAADWPSVDLHCLLLGEQSTAAPAPGDTYLTDINVEDNELVASGYVRQTCSGLASTWNSTSKLWELTAASTVFPTITPSLGGAVTCAVFYVPGTDDTDSLLVRTVVPLLSGVPTSIALTGSTFTVAWPEPVTIGNAP